MGAVRLDAWGLVVDAVDLHGVLQGGAGFRAGSATSRRRREAAFLPVQAPTAVQLRTTGALQQVHIIDGVLHNPPATTADTRPAAVEQPQQPGAGHERLQRGADRQGGDQRLPHRLQICRGERGGRLPGRRVTGGSRIRGWRSGRHPHDA